MLPSIMNEIELDLNLIGEEDLTRVAHSLRPPAESERALGIIHSLESRRIWALSYKYAGQALFARHEAEFRALEEMERQDRRNESERYGELSQLCRDIFWVQVRSDMGGDTWAAKRMGIREGFLVVLQEKSPTMGLDIRQLFRGGIPFSPPEEDDDGEGR